MPGSVVFLALVMGQLPCLFSQSVRPATHSHGCTVRVVQAPKMAPNNVDLPKPAVNPAAGTWKYKDTDVVRDNLTLQSTYSVTIRDDGGAWAVTTAMEFPAGPVTSVSTLEKGTLILRKKAFTHFLHPDQPWKPIAINLDFIANKITGTMKYVGAPDKPVTVDSGGPLFAEPAGWVGCLPLADGYMTRFRYFDIDRFALNPQAANKIKLVQLKVVGMESVTVPAGTFDSYKVEIISADGGSNKETIWIAKDSRMPVKISAVNELYGVSTTELIP